jgi:hypothetical protein
MSKAEMLKYAYVILGIVAGVVLGLMRTTS